METNNQGCNRGRSPFMAFISGILICAILGGGGFLFWQNMQENDLLKEKIESLENKMEENENEKIEPQENEIKMVVEEKTEEEIKITENAITYPEDTFLTTNNGDFYGRLTVSGYTRTDIVPQSFCDPEVDDGCSSFQYVSFNLVGDLSPEFTKFADSQEGNAFINRESVGLGCNEPNGGFLYYYNDSEDTGMKYYRLSEEDSKKLFSATKENPITITLERKPFYGGSGAPECYSHFTEITIY